METNKGTTRNMVLRRKVASSMASKLANTVTTTSSSSSKGKLQDHRIFRNTSSDITSGSMANSSREATPVSNLPASSLSKVPMATINTLRARMPTASLDSSSTVPAIQPCSKRVTEA